MPRWRTLAERATWAEVGYALLRLPVSAVTATVSIAAWTAGLVLLTLPLYHSALPGGGPELGGATLHGTPEIAVSCCCARD